MPGGSSHLEIISPAVNNFCFELGFVLGEAINSH